MEVTDVEVVVVHEVDVIDVVVGVEVHVVVGVEVVVDVEVHVVVGLGRIDVIVMVVS
jgi:hypothetical protein